MKNLTTELRVGLLLLAGMAIIVYASVVVTGWKPGQGATTALYVYFDNAAGLLTGSPVQVAGVKVGQIESIDLDGNRARVKLAIFKRYAMHADARAAIRSLGILGDKYIELNPGSSVAQSLVDGDSIPTVVAGGDLDSLVQTLSDVLRDVRSVTSALRDSLGGEKGRGVLDDIFSKIASAADDISHVTASLRKLLAGEDEKLAGMFANLDQSFAKLNSTMDSLRSVSKKMDAGEGTLGKLINDETTVEQLNSALTGLNRYLTDLDRIKLDIGVHTERLNEQQLYKSYLSIYLQPLKDRYYLLQLVDNPRGTTHTRTTITTTGGATTTSKDVVTTDELQLSLLVAQRYFDTLFKGGLMENAFGLGIEQYFGRSDQYRIGLDVWDFGNPLGPHVKLSGFWRFFSNAFIVVGGDDLANKEPKLRDAFFGIGIRFNEDSLKPLVSSLPIGK
jgi:phospholipid/cholesterol/gamma-HCH transport system substrate-binding protein